MKEIIMMIILFINMLTLVPCYSWIRRNLPEDIIGCMLLAFCIPFFVLLLLVPWLVYFIIY